MVNEVNYVTENLRDQNMPKNFSNNVRRSWKSDYELEQDPDSFRDIKFVDRGHRAVDEKIDENLSRAHIPNKTYKYKIDEEASHFDEDFDGNCSSC